MKDIRTHPLQTSMLLAALTALCLAGSLALAFITGNLLFQSLNVHISGLSSGLLALFLVLSGIFAGGALWGLGIAALTGGDTKRLVSTGSMTFGCVVLAAGILLELFFGLITVLSSSNGIPLHIAFTLVFVPAAGLIAALNSRRITIVVAGETHSNSVAWRSGLAAGLGFLVINLAMQSQGWIVGAPGAAERFTMITVMLTSNVGASLAGGAVLGWMLRKVDDGWPRPANPLSL